MKFPQRLKCLVFCLVFFSLQLFGQYRDTTFTVSASTSNPTTFHLQNLEAFSSNSPDRPPAYGIFWIFDNGNFMYVPDESDIVSTAYVEYDDAWPAGRSSIIMTVYLTERYSNDDPPKPPIGIIKDGTSNNGKATPATPDHNTVILETVPKVPFDRQVAMRVNHTPRANFDNVFAVSYAKDTVNEQQLWFFYGAKQQIDDPATLVKVDSIFTYNESHYPFYARQNQNAAADTIFKLAGDPGLKANAIQTMYTNYVKYGAPIAIPLEAIDERRIFHSFKTNPLSFNYADSLFNFLVVVTTPDDSRRMDFAQVSHPLQGRVDQIFKDSQFPMIDGQYVVDIRDTALLLETSHDPNGLRLTQTCHCTLNDKKCQLTFDLEICNAGNVAAKDVSVKLLELEKLGLTCPRVYRVEKLFDKRNTCDLGGANFQSPNDLFNGAEYRLPCPIPGTKEKGKYAPQCVKVHFSANGPNKLCEGRDGGLKDIVAANIKFSRKAPVISVKNEDARSSFAQANNSDSCKCGSTSTCDCIKFSLKCFFLHRPMTSAGILIGLAGIGYLFFRNRSRLRSR
ncbi:MAG: hypothetical protein AAFZ15_09395 [Bacteroidota bacterium]